MGGLALGGDHADPRPRRELGQAVEGFQMHLGEERDHRNPRPSSRRSTSGRWPKLVTAAAQRFAAVCRRTVVAKSLRSTLSTRTGRCASSSRPKKSSSGGLHSTRSTATAPGGRQPDAGHAQDPHRHVIGGHLEDRRADHRVLQKGLAASRERWRARGGHEHAFPAPRLHVPAPLEILDRARHRVRIDAEEAGQLRMLGNAWSRGTPPPSMTCFSCSVNCQRIGIGL